MISTNLPRGEDVRRLHFLSRHASVPVLVPVRRRRPRLVAPRVVPPRVAAAHPCARLGPELLRGEKPLLPRRTWPPSPLPRVAPRLWAVAGRRASVAGMVRSAFCQAAHLRVARGVSRARARDGGEWRGRAAGRTGSDRAGHGGANVPGGAAWPSMPRRRAWRSAQGARSRSVRDAAGASAGRPARGPHAQFAVRRCRPPTVGGARVSVGASEAAALVTGVRAPVARARGHLSYVTYIRSRRTWK